MSARRSRRILLHERHRQWELELIPEKEDEEEEVLRGLACFRRGVFNTVSAIFKTTGLQLEALAKARQRPCPDAWSSVGARDRLLTPWSHKLAVSEPVDARMMFGGGDSLPAMRITGLSTATFTPHTSLIFVFMPMSSFFTLPDTQYTLTDLTSKVFVPITEEQELDLVEEHGTEEDATQARERKTEIGTSLSERQKVVKEKEEQSRVLEQTLTEEKEQLTQKQSSLEEVEQQLTVRREQQEEQQKVLEDKEHCLTSREGEVSAREERATSREEGLTAREEKLNDREDGMNARAEQQSTREEEQKKREEEQNEKEQVLEKRAGEQNEREEQQTQKEAQLESKAEVLQSKENELSQQQKQQEETEQRLQEYDQQLQEKETRLGEELKAAEEKQQQLEEKEKALDSRQEEQEQKESELTAKENEIQQEQTLLQEKQEQNRQHEEDLKQREETLQQQTEQVREREQKVEEEEHRLQEWQQQNQEKETSLKQLEEQLEEQRTKLASEEEKLNNREASLNDMEAALNERREKLDEKENTLTEKEKALEEEKETLTKKSEELQQKEDALKEKETSLSELEESLNQMKTRLEQEEARLQQREKELTQLEEKLQAWETRNQDTEDRLNIRAQEVEESEERHRQWEIRSREEKEMIEERQKALQELEGMLKDWEKRSQEEEEKLKAEEQRIRSEEDRLQERERDIKDEEKRQKEWKDRLEEEDDKGKEMKKRLENEQEQQETKKEKRSENEKEQGEKTKQSRQSEERQKERQLQLPRTETGRKGDDDWQPSSKNSRFHVRKVKEGKGMVDRGVCTDRQQEPDRPCRRRARSLPPRFQSASPGQPPQPSPLASVLTEDDVLMISTYKDEKAFIIETYDIKYLREEIFDEARKSVSTTGILKPGRGLRESHESESFVLSAEETGRGSASPSSSSRSRSRSRSSSAQSQVSAETQTNREQESSSLKGGANLTPEPGFGQHATGSGATIIKHHLSPSHDQPAAKKTVSFVDIESDHSHSRSPPPIMDRHMCTSPIITFSREFQGADYLHETETLSETIETVPVKDSYVLQGPWQDKIQASQQEKLVHVRKTSSADKQELSLETSPTIQFQEPSMQQPDLKGEGQMHSQKQNLGPGKTDGKREQMGRIESKGPKKNEECSLERTDCISTSEESSESYEPSSEISIDCVSPEMAKLLPDWLASTSDQSPNDIVIDVTKEPGKLSSPPAAFRSDVAQQKKTAHRSSPCVTVIAKNSKTQHYEYSDKQTVNKKKESPFHNTCLQSSAASLSVMKAGSPKVNEKSTVVSLSKRNASPSARDRQISPSAGAALKRHRDWSPASKPATQNDDSEQQLKNRQLPHTEFLRSPPNCVSPSSPLALHRSPPTQQPIAKSLSPVSVISASPTSSVLSPLTYKVSSKTPSPSSTPERRLQGKQSSTRSSPLESVSMQKKTKSMEVFDASPVKLARGELRQKAEAAQLPHGTLSPVSDRKAQTQTSVPKTKVPSSSKSNSRSPTRSPASKCGANSESVSACAMESVPLPQLKSPPGLSPETATKQHKFPSVEQDFPVFITALLQSLEKMQVPNMATLQPNISYILSSPTKSGNASLTGSVRSSRSPTPTKHISPSVNTLWSRSSSPFEFQHNSEHLEQCEERKPASQAVSTKSQSSSPVQVSPNLPESVSYPREGISSSRQVQPKPHNDKEQKGSGMSSPSDQSALLRSPLLKSPQDAQFEARPAQLKSVVSPKSPSESTTWEMQTSVMQNSLNSSWPLSKSPKALSSGSHHQSPSSPAALKHSMPLTSESAAKSPPGTNSPLESKLPSTFSVPSSPTLSTKTSQQPPSSVSPQVAPEFKRPESTPEFKLSVSSLESNISESVAESKILGSPQVSPKSKPLRSPQEPDSQLLGSTAEYTFTGSPEALHISEVLRSTQARPKSTLLGSPQEIPDINLLKSPPATLKLKLSKSTSASKQSESAQTTPDIQLSGSPQAPHEPALSGSPQPTLEFRLSGSPQATHEPALSGSPQPTLEFRLSGSPQATHEPALSVSSQPTLEFRLSGSPQATHEPALSGSPQPTLEFRLSGSPQATYEPALSVSSQPTLEFRLSGSPQATHESKLSGSPQPMLNFRPSGSPEATHGPELSGSPQTLELNLPGSPKASLKSGSTPDFKLSGSPQASQKTELLGSQQAMPESIYSGSPLITSESESDLSPSLHASQKAGLWVSQPATPESIHSGSQLITSGSRFSRSSQVPLQFKLSGSPPQSKVLFEDTKPMSVPVYLSDRSPPKTTTTSSLSALHVQVPSDRLENCLPVAPENDLKSTQIKQDSPFLADQKTSILYTEQMADTVQTKEVQSQKENYPPTKTNSSESKLQTLVAHFERFAQESSYQPDSASITSKQRRQQSDDQEQLSWSVTPQESHTPSQSSSLSPSPQPENTRHSPATSHAGISSFVSDDDTHTETPSKQSRHTDLVSEESLTPPGHWLRQENWAVSTPSTVRSSTKTSPVSPWISQTSSNRKRSPGPKMLPAECYSPNQGRSLAGLLAVQRKKIDTPWPSVHSETEMSSSEASPSAQPAHPLLKTGPNAEDVSQPDGTELSTAELLTPFSIPSSPSPKLLPSDSSPPFTQPQPPQQTPPSLPPQPPKAYTSPVRNVSSSDVSDVQKQQPRSWSVSPSRALVSTALKTNGVNTLQTMLAKQRKARQTKGGENKPQATSFSHRSEETENEFSPTLKAKMGETTFPQEHRTTSVHQTVIDRKGKPPSSIVTITQKRVRYSKEPVAEDCGSHEAYSPPKISNVSAPTHGSIHHPKAMPLGSTDTDRRTQLSETATRQPSSLPGSDMYRKYGKVSSALDYSTPSTAPVKDFADLQSADRPQNTKELQSKLPKGTLTSQSPTAKPALRLIRIIMNTDTQQTDESEKVAKRPSHAKTRIPQAKIQGGHSNFASPTLHSEQSPMAISTKTSEIPDNKEQHTQLHDTTQPSKENWTCISSAFTAPDLHGSQHLNSGFAFKTDQMNKREALLRQRAHSKLLYQRKSSVGKQFPRMASESDDSDFSDFFQEYQTECQRRGTSSEKSPAMQMEGVTTAKQQHHESRNKRVTPTPTSPPVKRRALDASDDMDTIGQSRQKHSPHTLGPSNTCNSSPVKRSKRYEMKRFLAYPRSSPTRTHHGTFQQPSDVSPALGAAVNRSIFPLPVGATLDRNMVPMAFSPQLQTFRHQQGVVGDSVEMVEDVARPGRSNEFPSEEQSSYVTREKRRKQVRRVSWNDTQSSSTADLSHNQNAALDTRDEEKRKHRRVGRSQLSKDQIISDGESVDSLQNDSVSLVQSDTRDSDGEVSLISYRQDSSDQSLKDARFVQPVTTNKFQQSIHDSHQPPETKYLLSESLTDHSQFNKEFGSDKKVTKTMIPTAVQFSREQTKSTEYRPRGDTLSFAKEEATKRKEFISSTSSESVNMAQKQCLRKSYTMQNQHKRAVITEERQQTTEYVFKKNPHTAPFPEHTRHPAQVQPENVDVASMNTQNNASCDEMESEPHVVKGGEIKHHSETYSQGSATNNLSLGQVLWRVGFCQGAREKSEELEEQSTEGDSVDLMDYGDVDQWIDMPVDPYFYQCSRNQIYNLNESANSSALAGQEDSSSPEEKVFFTPQVVTDDRKITGNVPRVHLTPTPQVQYMSFESQHPHSHLLLTDHPQKVGGAFYSPSSSLDECCNSLYFSIPYSESASLESNEETPLDCRTLLQYRRRRYKRYNGNKNNSGDDHPNLTSQPNLSRKEEQCVYDGILEASACGRGDHVEKVEPKTSEESHQYVGKEKDYLASSGSSMTVLRRKRSFGRTYLSRLLTRRKFIEHVSQDLSDNCAHAHASVPEFKEHVCGSQCCQCPGVPDNTEAESVGVSCSDCNCEETKAEFCLCLENSACCQHTPYNENDEEDPDDDDEDADDCQERCEECGCSMDFRTALTLQDQKLVPRAVSQLWRSPGQSGQCVDPDCLVATLHSNTETKFKSCQTSQEEEQEQYVTRSLPSAYTESCKCAHSYCPGRGDGDVLPAIRKEEQNYNVSRCQWEEPRLQADFVFRHNPEATEESKEHKRKGRLKPKEKDDRRLAEENAGKHSHHLHHCSESEHLAHKKSLEVHSHSSEAKGVHDTASPKDAPFSVTESMVQAYGYNPLTQSPFTARGYPALIMDTSNLDHITLPFVKRKALEFLRTDKEEFVEVGRGTYGCVYLAQATTKRGTAKVVVKDFFTDSSSWELIVHEARMLCYLEDTGVIPHFYGLLKRRSHSDDFSLIQQYFAQGRTLHTVLVNKEQLSPDVWQDVAWQLARGLLLIHERHVLLNDLKGDNVLIDLRRERKIIKYIDLGMATYRKGLNFHLPEDQMSKFNFLSPEVRAGAYTSPMSDVYSLGYLLDQINRLAHLHVLKEVSSRCMDELPVDRLHLADVVHVLTPDPDFLSAGSSHRH